MQFTRLGIILFTKNYEACVDFYTKTLGLPVTYEKDEPGSILTCCDFGGAYLMIEVGGPEPPQTEDKTKTKTKTIEQNPSKLRFNVEDVERAAAELRKKGVAIQVETHP